LSFDDFVLVGFSLLSNALRVLDELLSLFLLDLLWRWLWWHWFWWCWWLGIVVWELLLQVGLSQLGILIDFFQLQEGLLLWLNKSIGALLNDVVVLTLHSNIESQILIAIHTGCEELHVHGDLRLCQILLRDMIVLTLHDDVEAKVLVTIHALSEESAGRLLGDSDIVLRNVIILALHNDVEAEVLVSVHARGEETALWLDQLLLEGLLSNMVVLTFHDNIHAEVLVTVHAGGEERLRTLKLLSNLLLNLFVFLGTFVELVVLAFEIGILLLHSLQLLLINC